MNLMIHKIQTADNTFVSLEVKQIKSQLCLYISKGASSLYFNLAETQQLNAVVQSIDGAKYALKEYGIVKKGSEIYKVFISEFRGIKSFQIRQWTSTPSYSGYGKLGITLPTYKIKELQMHLTSVMQEFEQLQKDS